MERRRQVQRPISFVHRPVHLHNECLVILYVIRRSHIAFTLYLFGCYGGLVQQSMNRFSMHCQLKNKPQNRNEKVGNDGHRNVADDNLHVDVYDNDSLSNSITKRRTTTITAASMTARTQESYLMSSTLTNQTYYPSYLSTSLYSSADHSSRTENGFFDDYDDDFDSLQYQFSSYGYEAFKLFELFTKRLNNIKYLQHILHNWVIGNRIILKYTNRTDGKDPIRALASVFRVSGQCIDQIIFFFFFLVIFT